MSHEGVGAEGKVTPMQFVAMYEKYLEVIPLLSANRADINFTGSNGFTPLMLASYNGCLKVVNQLIDLGARHDISTDEKTALDYAIDYAAKHKDAQVVKRLFPLFPERAKSLALKYIIEQDEIHSFRAILRSSHRPSMEELKLAKDKIKKLIDYKPARREKNRKKYQTFGEYYADIKARKETALLDFLHDEENTTDEDSSDSEDDEFQLIKETGAFDSTKVFARGVHFCPRYFNAKQRSSTKKREYHVQTV